MEITKIERNELFRIIRKARLKPRDFTFRHEPESSVIVIQHPRTGGWIGLSLDGDEPRDWEIGMDRPLPNTSRDVVGLNLAVRGRPEAWKYMLDIVTAWTSQIRERVAELERLEKARREYEAIPDLWEQIAKLGTPASPGVDLGGISGAYAPTKTYLNAVTIQYAKELSDTNVLINNACPGYVATDLNAFNGTQTPEQGAAIAIRLATLPDDGPTGGLFDDTGIVPW